MTFDFAPLAVSSWIGGEWLTPAAAAERLPVVYAGTAAPVSELIEAGTDDVDAAVTDAQQTFESGVWSDASVDERKAVLLRIRDGIRARHEELVRLEVLHTGAPIRQVRGRHIARTALNFEFFAEFISQAANPIYDQHPDYLSYVRRDPVGVAGLIAPWNAPLALASMKVAAAIAFGNSCVLKPSELTPLSFAPLMEIIQQAGVPNGVVNLVNGRGPVTGAALVEHPGVRALSFTGGTATGRQIGATAGRTLKKTVTELGGKSANIIFADADLDRALDAALVAIFSNNGQQCLAGSRILLQRSIAAEFRERFVARAQRLRIGDPFDDDTDIGPLISAAQRDRVLGFARRADDAADCELLTGGHVIGDLQPGFYVAPTVAIAANNANDICQQEIFGPFATFLEFDTADEAVAIANDSEFGLVAYLWSRNVDTVMSLSEKLRAGVVWVNTPLTRELRAPFGGYRNSGVGRDGGEWSRSLFTEEKTVTIPVRDFPIVKMGA